MTRQRAPRVAFVVPFGLSRRGTVPFRVLPMAWSLERMGAEVRIIVPNWDAPAGHRVSTKAVGEHVEMLVLPVPPRWRRPGRWGTVVAAHALIGPVIQHVRAWHPDYIHLVKPLGASVEFLAWVRFARLLGQRGDPLGRLPLILDCDDLENAWFRSHGLLVSLLVSWGERWAWRLADRVTVASRFLWALVARARGDEKVHYVPNAVFPPEQRVHPQRSQRLLVPTRLLDIRPEVLARWLRAILARIPEMNVLLVGPQAERLAAVQRALTDAGIQRQVAVLQWQPIRAYERLLYHTRVGLYAVEDTPAARAKSPARLLHMMAHGIPVVAADVGDAGYIVGHTGRCVPPTPDAMGEAVRDLWFQGELLDRLGRAAQRRVVREFSLEKMGERLRAVYEASLSR